MTQNEKNDALGNDPNASGLSGDNIVHYNLPRPQQVAIELP